MTIKVEVYYEVSAKAGNSIPPDIKRQITEGVWDRCPNNLVVKTDFWEGDQITAKKLSNAEIHERIRTAK